MRDAAGRAAGGFMAIGGSPERDPDARETARGVALVLAAGVALGVAWNALGLAGRLPRGTAWPERRSPAASVEAAQPTRPVASAADTAHKAAEQPPAPVPVARAEQPPEQSSPASDLPVIPDVPGPLTLELPTIKRLYDAGASVVDAREADAYAAGHIAGAISLPYNDALADPERVKPIGLDGQPVMIYCSGPGCDLSMDLAKLLVQSGKRKVLVYEGGYPGWEAAGYPVQRGPEAGARP